MFYSLLYIDGQSYVVLPNNIFYTKQWKEIIYGKEVTDAIFEFCEKFNELKLTDYEKAILFPMVLTKFGKI